MKKKQSKLEAGFGKDHTHRDIEGVSIIAGQAWWDEFDKLVEDLYPIGNKNLRERRKKRNKRSQK